MTAIAAIPCSEPDECFFLFLSQPLRQNSFNLTFSPIIGEYYKVTVYGGGNILPYANMVYVNSHDNQVSGVIEATVNAVGIFAWVYNRVAN